MRKIFVFMLAVLMIFFAACSSGEVEEAQQEVEENIETVKEVAEDLGVGEETVDNVVEEVSEAISNATDITEEGIEEVTQAVEETLEEGLSEEIGVDVEVDDEGTFVVDSVDLGVNSTDLGEDPGIDVWCVPGTEYENENEYGSAIGEIVGPTTFKDSEYCQATGTVDLGNGFEIETTHYFTYGSKDLWIVTNIYGQEVEQRIITE